MISLIKRALAVAVSASILAFGTAALDILSHAQEKTPPSYAERAEARADKLAATLEDAFHASRFMAIYADLRYALRELYLPVMKDALREESASAFDAHTKEAISLMAPLIEYLLKAAEELDPVLEAKRKAILSDVASLLTRHMPEEEVRLIGEMLQTPAMRKGFNAFYAFSRLITGYTREDMQSSQEMAKWMRDFKLDLKTNPFAEKNAVPPPRERVVKAEAIVADFMRISRVDEMVAEIVRFNREVMFQIDTLSDSEREQLRAGVEQFEFFYNLGKSTAIAVAPSALASTLDDEQLGKFHLIILSPVIAKSFGLLYGFVREATSFTQLDLEEVQDLAAQAESFSPSRGADADHALQAEWQELVEKWREIFLNSLTPETRSGLENAIAEFQAFAEERDKREQEGIEPDELAPGERQL